MGTWMSPTKMFVTLLLLLASSFIAVESSSFVTSNCPRSDWGKETTEENWECSNGESSCHSYTETCSNDGELTGFGGIQNYDIDGNLLATTGGGWDCRDKCRGCRFSCKGSQSKTKFGAGLF